MFLVPHKKILKAFYERFYFSSQIFNFVNQFYVIFWTVYIISSNPSFVSSADNIEGDVQAENFKKHRACYFPRRQLFVFSTFSVSHPTAVTEWIFTEIDYVFL